MIQFCYARTTLQIAEPLKWNKKNQNNQERRMGLGGGNQTHPWFKEQRI